MKNIISWLGCIILSSFVLLGQNVSAQGYEDQINKVSVKMAESIQKSGKSRVAVVDFTDLEGNVTALGRFIAEEFSVALLNTGKEFELIDRTHLNSLLKEHKLSTTGLIDPATARKLGEIAGVEALITGTITPFGENIRLSVKILDAGTARLIGANTGEIPQTKAIEELLGMGIATTGGTSTSFIKDQNKPTPTTNTQQTTKVGDITFSQPSCKRSGKNLICSVLLKINTQQTELRVFAFSTWGLEEFCGRSRIVDNLGNEHTAKHITIGDRGEESYVDTIFAVGIPTKVNFLFEDFSSEAVSVALIVEFRDMWSKDPRHKWYSAQLLDIPISQ